MYNINFDQLIFKGRKIVLLLVLVILLANQSKVHISMLFTDAFIFFSFIQ